MLARETNGLVIWQDRASRPRRLPRTRPNVVLRIAETSAFLPFFGSSYHESNSPTNLADQVTSIARMPSGEALSRIRHLQRQRTSCDHIPRYFCIQQVRANTSQDVDFVYDGPHDDHPHA